MHYDSELRLLIDTLKKYGLPVNLSDPDSPLPDGLFPLYLPEPIAHKSLRQLLPMEPATVYTVTVHHCCFTYFLLPEQQPEALMSYGPYLQEPVTLEEILESADPKFHKSLEKFYASLPIFPASSHLHLLTEVFYDRIWGMGSYSHSTVMQSQQDNNAYHWLALSLSDSENSLLSATIMEERYNHENSLIDAIQKGQKRRLETLLSRISEVAFEQRSADPVRNVKNYCIITNTLFRKAAEQGGVHPVYIDKISTGFALRIEQLNSSAAGISLITEMAKTYCRLVREHSTKGYSSPIQKAILLIEGNLSQPLSLSQLAGELNVNSSYLSTLFKKETGSTLTDYIVNRRISQARHLLETTRLQIQTIAQLCGFEDVHYFSKVFKRLTQQTPKQYRQSF